MFHWMQKRTFNDCYIPPDSLISTSLYPPSTCSVDTNGFLMFSTRSTHPTLQSLVRSAPNQYRDVPALLSQVPSHCVPNDYSTHARAILTFPESQTCNKTPCSNNCTMCIFRSARVLAQKLSGKTMFGLNGGWINLFAGVNTV